MFREEDGQDNIYIVQEKCDRITIVLESASFAGSSTEKHALKLDGKPRADTVWIGGPKPSSITSARFIGPELHIATNNVGGSPATFIFSLNADRDLLEGVNLGGAESREAPALVLLRRVPTLQRHVADEVDQAKQGEAKQ
jgi:hypothetical protein